MKKLKDKNIIINNEVLSLYSDVSKFGLQYQADSFNAIDSKSQTFISVLSIFIALVVGLLAFKFDSFSQITQEILKYVSALVIFLLVLNIILFFFSMKSQKFKYGYSILELREIDDGKNNLDEIKKEVSDSFEVAFKDNIDTLRGKDKIMNISEIFLLINIFISLLYSLVFIFIL